MGDMGDFFKLTKEDRRKRTQARKEKNKEYALKRLDELNVNYRSKDGVHFIIESTCDYWPTTGLFKFRKCKTRGRGIERLIQELEARYYI